VDISRYFACCGALLYARQNRREARAEANLIDYNRLDQEISAFGGLNTWDFRFQYRGLNHAAFCASVAWVESHGILRLRTAG
jgi:hypothetical protein